MPVASIVPEQRRRRTSASTPSARVRGSSSSGSTTTICCSRRNPPTSAARRRSTRCAPASSPSRARRVAEFESGNVDVLQIPGDRSVGLAGGREHEAAAHVHAGARAGVHRHQHDARPARRRARSSGDQLRDRRQSHHRAADQRARHSRRRRHSARARRLRQHAQSRIRTIRRRRSSSSPRPDIRTASTSSSGRRSTPIYLRIAETIQAYLERGGHSRRRSSSAKSAAARGAARKGQTDMILKDWYADYPDAEDFLYPLLHSANSGAGGNVSFYSNPVFDSIVTRVAPRARRNEAQRAVSPGRLDRVRRRADGLSVLLQRAVRRAALDQALRAAGDLQRPALDRRHDRHEHEA